MPLTTENRPEETVEHPPQFGATLRVIASDLTLSDLVAELGPCPKGHSAGDEKFPGVKHSSTVWLYDSDMSQQPLASHLEVVVQVAVRKKLAIARLQARGCRADIWCSVDANGKAWGSGIDADVLQTVGNLGLSLELDSWSSNL